MAKKAILGISIILVSNLFLGCIDTKSIGGGTDLITKCERSGIFSENCDYYHQQLLAYHAIYNNGKTLDISYEKDRVSGSIMVKTVTCREKLLYDQIRFKNEKPAYYCGGFSGESVYWDDGGRVDPMSDGDVDEANRFAEAALKKGKEVLRRSAAGELDEC